MKEIYIVLSHSGTKISNLINLFTHDKYSHISLSFDKKCNLMYSFGRKYDLFPFYGVFKEENIKENLFVKKDNSIMAIYELKVTKKKYKKIKYKIEEIKKGNKGYNIIGLILAEFKIKLNRKKYYCSEFIYEVLSDKKINIINKNKKIFRPEEIINNLKTNKIYEGRIKNYISNF